MPTPTYDLIASNVLSSSASSVTFSSIPATYRDLIVVSNILGTGFVEVAFRFNSDTGSNYHYVKMRGDGSTATSDAAGPLTEISSFTATANASNRGLSVAQIMDYSATDKHKTVLLRNNNAASGFATEGVAGRWAHTSAITSITILTNGANNYASGSTFYLYGIVS